MELDHDNCCEAQPLNLAKPVAFRLLSADYPPLHPIPPHPSSQSLPGAISDAFYLPDSPNQRRLLAPNMTTTATEQAYMQKESHILAGTILMQQTSFHRGAGCHPLSKGGARNIIACPVRVMNRAIRRSIGCEERRQSPRAHKPSRETKHYCSPARHSGERRKKRLPLGLPLNDRTKHKNTEATKYRNTPICS